ncbi:MAG TPA: four helix bundle protein [Gemmatimonadales bacterium]
MRKLDSLLAWTNGRTVARSAYRLTLVEPLWKHFGLSDQIRRACASIPANIAEGYALGTTPQFIKHLQIALGSATELATHLELVKDLELAPREDIEQALELSNQEIGLLIGLVYSLRSRRELTRPPSPVPRP